MSKTRDRATSLTTSGLALASRSGLVYTGLSQTFSNPSGNIQCREKAKNHRCQQRKPQRKTKIRQSSPNANLAFEYEGHWGLRSQRLALQSGQTSPLHTPNEQRSKSQRSVAANPTRPARWLRESQLALADCHPHPAKFASCTRRSTESPRPAEQERRRT